MVMVLSWTQILIYQILKSGVKYEEKKDSSDFYSGLPGASCAFGAPANLQNPMETYLIWG